MSFPVGQYDYALSFTDGKMNFSDLLRGGTQTEDREVSQILTPKMHFQGIFFKNVYKYEMKV